VRNKSVLLLLAVLLTGAIVLYLIIGGNSAGGGNSETGTQHYDSSFAGSILINEAMASNPGVVPARDGGFYDWVELYNPTDADVNISGWGLSDEANVAAKWTFGEGTVVPAKGYLLIFCSDLNQTDPSGELHASFKLKAGSDTVVLSDATGKAVDKLPLPHVTEGHSVGRNAEDISDWLDFSEPTPGFSNDAKGRAAYVASMDASSIGLLISEFQPSNKTTIKTQSGEYSDWVEIYNPTDKEIDLTGFGLSDDRTKPLKWTFPQGTRIPAGGRILVWCGGYVDVSGLYPDELHATFSLNSFEESVVLSDSSGRIIDAVDYSGIGTDASYARQPDGSWQATARPTPGYENTDEGYAAFAQQEAAATNGGGLLISEVMAAKDETILDGDAYYDWIELYNTTGETVDLSGWGLSDNTKNPQKWTFPEGTAIAPGEYKLVMASGLNIQDPQAAKTTFLHTSFKVDALGEVICLSRPDGTIVDKLNIGNLRGGITCGKDTSGRMFYYDTPTPGQPNAEGKIGFAPQPEFELAPGFYYGRQTVSIKVPEGTTVYYTTDGRIPTQSDTRYTGPISIEKTTSVRAVAVQDGYLASPPKTASYLIDSPHSDALSVVFVTMNPKDLFDETTGIYVLGPNPGAAPHYRNANFQKEWERECNVEIFDTQGNAQINQQVAIRIFGAFSRLREQKGFALMCRERYGADSFDFPIFENRDIDSYSSLVLRAGGQDSTVTKIKDIVSTGLVDGTTNLEVQAYRQAVLYINGEYFGVYNIREKVNKDFIAAHYPEVDAENIDLLVGNGTALWGDNKAYKEMISWCAQTDFSSDENYEKLARLIDVDNYIDYLICEMYVANTDSGNIKYFRERSDDPEKSKWRWIYYDFCWTFIGADKDFVTRFTDPAGHGVGKGFSTQLTRSLMQNKQFREKLIHRAAELLNTIYTPENVLAKIEECSSAIYDEVGRPGGDAERWPEGSGFGNWKACVKGMRNFARQRRNYMIQHIKSYFGLSEAKTREIFGEKDVVELE
jgi:hypothetical protein